MPPMMLSRIRHVLSVVALLALPAAGCADDARDRAGFGAGFELRPQAGGADVGLSIYPGAVRRLDKDDDSNGLTFAAWGGAWGFRIAVLKLTSPASIDQVAGFYRDELRRYGEVLDCSRPHAKAASGRDDGRLNCDDDSPEAGARVYKVGVARHQRVVSLKARDGSVHIDLVRIDAGE